MSKAAAAAKGKGGAKGGKDGAAGEAGSGAAGGAGGGVGGAAGGDEFSTLPIPELKRRIAAMSLRLLESKRIRNYHQQEKDQLQEFHDVVSEEVTKTESHVRNIEAQMERMEETHRSDIKVYMQKVTHLEYEQTHNLQTIAASVQSEAAQSHAAHRARLMQHNAQRLALQQQLHVQEVTQEEEIKKLKENERKEMQKLRETFERHYNDQLAYYEERMRKMKEDMTLATKMEMHEIEERKNKHIEELAHAHQQAYNEMKAYYQSITSDNILLIRELQAEVESLRESGKKKEEERRMMEKKNEEMNEPMREMEKKVEKVRLALSGYEKEKTMLARLRKRKKKMEEEWKSMKEEWHRMEEEYRQRWEDKERLANEHHGVCETMRDHGDLKNSVLSRRLEDMAEMFEIKKAQFASVLRASNLDPHVLTTVTSKLDDVLTAKNSQLEALEYEVAKLRKGHNDLIRVYEEKLWKLGVRFDPQASASGGGGAFLSSSSSSSLASTTLMPVIGITSPSPANLIVE